MHDPRLTETCRLCPHRQCPLRHGPITSHEAARALAEIGGPTALFQRHPTLRIDELRRAVDGFLLCAGANYSSAA